MVQSSMPDISFDVPLPEPLERDSDFWQLYDSSFPASEREPRAVILETIRRGDGLTLRARLGKGTVALAITHLLRNPPALFLVYLAVTPELRSRHLGSRLFEEVWRLSRKKYVEGSLEPLGVVWEVDITERAATEQDRLQGYRRLQFFTRLGGRVLSQRYFQPPVDGVEPVEMSLMFRPAQGSVLPDARTCAALVRALYYEKYQQANGISPAVLNELLHRIGIEANT